MDMPLSMTVGAPNSPKLIARGHWSDDEIEWFIALNFNDPERPNSIVLSHLNEGWQILATIVDEDGAVAREAIDRGDDDPEGFARRLLERLASAAGQSLPAHVAEHFHRAIFEWVIMWRRRAAELVEAK